MESVYTSPVAGNIPRQAAYPYGLPYLQNQLPQTHWPWDAAHDTKYQRDIQNPNYAHYAQPAYPYWVRRHRAPTVFSQPKPVGRRANGYTFQIPPRSPYVYWYPNPVECSDACGTEVCVEYQRRLNNYKMCQMCQSLKKPMCYSAQKQQCVPCAPEQALSSCEENYGCRNPNGWVHNNVAPINPKYTGCQLCN